MAEGPGLLDASQGACQLDEHFMQGGRVRGKLDYWTSGFEGSLPSAFGLL